MDKSKIKLGANVGDIPRDMTRPGLALHRDPPEDWRLTGLAAHRQTTHEPDDSRMTPTAGQIED